MGTKLYRIVIICLLIGLFAVGLLTYLYKPKTGYIIIQEVYNGFTMKIEMEKKYLQTTVARQKRIDSLQFELKSSAEILDKNEKNSDMEIQRFEKMRSGFLKQKQEMDEDNKNLMQQFDSEILVQLNQYVKDYGTDNGYEYIHGSNGSGALMFGNESKNISKSVLEFINAKYAGRK
jgi:outer membrane protein